MSMLINPYRFAAGGGVGTYEEEVNADSPVAWWRFEETSGSTVADEVGTNDGTVFGADLNQGLGLSTGSGASFDGVDDYINLGINAYDLGIRRAATFTALGKVDTISGVQDILSDWKDSQGLTLRVTDGGGFEAYVYPGNYRITTATGLLGVGDPFHVALVLDTTQMRIYHDGTEVGSTSLDGDVGNSTATLKVAVRGDENSSTFLDGIIDEPAVFDAALTSTRIQAHVDAAGIA